MFPLCASPMKQSMSNKYTQYPIALNVLLVFLSVLEQSWDAFNHIIQGYFAGMGTITRLSQDQWNKHEGYG